LPKRRGDEGVRRFNFRHRLRRQRYRYSGRGIAKLSGIYVRGNMLVIENNDRPSVVLLADDNATAKLRVANHLAVGQKFLAKNDARANVRGIYDRVSIYVIEKDVQLPILLLEQKIARAILWVPNSPEHELRRVHPSRRALLNAKAIIELNQHFAVIIGLRAE